MTEWIQVADASEIAPGKSKVVKVLGASVAVFNVGGRFCAIDNACPHQGGPLGEGILEGEVVTCPWHNWRYRVTTGCPVLTPDVGTFEARVNGSGVEIGVSRELYEAKQAERTSEPDPAFEVLEQINSARTLDEVVDRIYSGLQKIVPHNRLGIAFIDESSGKLVQVKTRSDQPILLNDGFSARIAGSSLERILQAGEPRILDDLQEHFSKRPSEWTRLILAEGMRSSLTLPLKVEGKAIGVIFFTSAAPHGFREAHVGFLLQIAGQLSILIEKGRWVTELAQSNERYRILFEMSNEGIFLCASPHHAFVTVNDRLGCWLGHRSGEMAKLSLSDLLSSAESPRVGALLESVPGNSAPVIFETELSRKNGGPLPVEIRAFSVEHRGGRFVQGFVRDLSELRALKEQARLQASFGGIIGKNRNMQDIYELIRLVAPMSTTVLVQGESGTGKELVARAIHENSPRKNKAFVAVNCGALVETLLESELFGHVRGAFTGAIATRQGRFEVADGGTIFLDEIGDLSLAMQVRLLRVLQEGVFQKVGSTITQKVDVRVIAATHRNLKAAIQAGTFREDLFYRLNVVPITLPPLRERRDDIPLLVRHFVEKFSRQTRKTIQNLAPDALDVLMEYSYPGNVRELENIIEHAFVKCLEVTMEKKHLPSELVVPKADIVMLALAAENPLAALEKQMIRKVLEQCDGQTHRAARRLGISRTTLWRKLRNR